ncbi:MAG: dihydrofolate reductase [Candidatus Paceibacterota bacterium]
MMHFPHIPVVIVAAISRKSRAIGYKNKLLWHIPADLKRFKELSMGHPIIMGRKTFESIVAMLGKPLPGRTNIVLTRNTDYAPQGAEVAHSLEAAFAIAERENPTEIHIGGGAELYEVALPYVSKLHLTLVESEPVADTYFPEYENHFVPVKEHPVTESGNLSFQWVDLERKRN